MILLFKKGFPDSSVGKESACNAGDPSLIPGSGRSTGEGIGYPLQYSWTSLMAQLVKNPPAMWETWVWTLGWEDPLEKGKATHSSILAWRIPWTYRPWCRKESDMTERLSLFIMELWWPKNQEYDHSSQFHAFSNYFWDHGDHSEEIQEKPKI